jgi:hypothetical protein
MHYLETLDIFLFHKLKTTLKEKRFSKIENSAMRLLLAILKIEIERASQNWQEQWNMCTC